MTTKPKTQEQAVPSAANRLDLDFFLSIAADDIETLYKNSASNQRANGQFDEGLLSTIVRLIKEFEARQC